jgi:hypothetical protein
VLLLFLLQQAFVLARTWVRLLFYAAQSQMFDALVPRLLIRESPAPGVAPDMPTLPEPPPEAA